MTVEGSWSVGNGPLRDGDTVVVVGGGPAGAFFTRHLLREAERLHRHLDAVIVEKRGSGPLGPTCWHCRRCTFCAGGISPRLHQAFEQDGLSLPKEVIQDEIDSVWIQGEWKNFLLRVPPGLRMYTVFRGSLPEKRGSASAGLDAFLLDEAVRAGARVLTGEVGGLDYAASGRPVVVVRSPSGATTSLESSFVVVAVGINTGFERGGQPDPLVRAIRRINPAFSPGRVRKTFIFEIDAGEAYLKTHMDGEIHFIEYGSKDLALEHTALVPKGRFLTVAMIGKAVDAIATPRDGEQIVRAFLRLPQIGRILPGLDDRPLACACFPSLPVTTARSPFGHRVAIIGDAVGARLNKDGLYSARVTAHRLADTLLHDGVDSASLARGYGPTVRWLETDNRAGRLVFGLSRVAFGRTVFSRIIYQAFATELKVRDPASRPLGVALWKIASGTADYAEVLRSLCGYPVWRSVLIGAAVTARNVCVERVLGLRWGQYGRYPTVVPTEEREAVREALAASLGRGLDAAPDFERMYTIKIRGSVDAIVEELATFGEPAARFLNLRFIEVRRIAGGANAVGAVVRYGLRLLGVIVDLVLRQVGFGLLAYDVRAVVVERGTLIFHIAPKEHGNCRLAVYTAFDFKRGRHPVTRAFWWGVRTLFPHFVHDVVWNHALCCIKEEVEGHGGLQASSSPAGPAV